MDKYYSARAILNAIVSGKGLKSFLTSYIADGVKIYLYGASELGDIIIKLCNLEGIIVSGVCDGAVCSDGWTYLGIPLICKESLKKMEKMIVIISAVGFEDEIRKELLSMGIKDVYSITEIFR